MKDEVVGRMVSTVFLVFVHRTSFVMRRGGRANEGLECTVPGMVIHGRKVGRTVAGWGGSVAVIRAPGHLVGCMRQLL